MFRLVKTPDSAPAYFLLCDHRSCMEARRGPAVVVNAEEYLLSKRAFVKSAIAEGWWVDLEGCYCPAHARDLLYAAQQAKQKVEAAKPEQILAFGRGL